MYRRLPLPEVGQPAAATASASACMPPDTSHTLPLTKNPGAARR